MDREDIRALVDALNAYEPARWTQMPDIELYMDQVVTYLKRQLELFQGTTDASLVTPSIINNYVKDGIVDRPVKKKYGKAQLGALTMACILKRALPMFSIKKLIATDGPMDEECYERFFAEMRRALREESAALDAYDPDTDEGDLKGLATWFALRASVDCLIADLLITKLEPPDKKAEKNRRRAE